MERAGGLRHCPVADMRVVTITLITMHSSEVDIEAVPWLL